MKLHSDHRINSSRRNPRRVKGKQINTKNEILFMCPELEEGVYTKNVWKEKVIAYIANRSSADRVRACIVAIKTFNSESEICYSLKILRTYLSNLVNFPNEQKYKRIRAANPFLQKLRDVVGAVEFLQAIGFRERSVFVQIGNEKKEESYLVHERLKGLVLPKILEELNSVRGFTLSLFRNVMLIEPSTDPVPEEPDDFYEWTVQDMEREYQFRKKKAENNERFRTKKMREEHVKADSDYTIIRVSFPEDIIIQATFSTKETLQDLKSLLWKNMEFSRMFFFVLPPSKRFSEDDENRTFLDLDLFPSVTLLARWMPDPRAKQQL